MPWEEAVSGAGLSRQIVQLASSEVFMTQLVKGLSNMVWSHTWLCFEQEVGLKTCWGSSSPEWPYTVTFAVLYATTSNAVCHKAIEILFKFLPSN